MPILPGQATFTLRPYPEVDLHLLAVLLSPILDKQGLGKSGLLGSQEQCSPDPSLLFLPVQLEFYFKACGQKTQCETASLTRSTQSFHPTPWLPHSSSLPYL